MEFESIYCEVAPKLQSYLMGNGCSYATACDIVQETFLRLWKQRDELSDDLHQVSGLAFTIARNYRNDLSRKARHEVFGDGTEEESDDACGEPVRDDAARPGEASEEMATLRRHLKATLARMPGQLLEVFALSRIGNLSVKEIADGTGVSEANVRVRVHRAREMFLSCFNARQTDRVAHRGTLGAAFAVLRAMMMLAAVDGEITREELSLYRQLAEEFHLVDSAMFEERWEQSVRAMAYMGFLSEVVSPEDLAGEFSREVRSGFADVADIESAHLKTALERMAAADGNYSSIERNCIAALV